MAHFDIIPYVFELARIKMGKENDKKFCMKYEEYQKYVEMFEELDEDERASLIEKVKSKKKFIKR